jgi:hypothetical protein
MKFRQISSLILISAIALSAAVGSDEFQLMRDEAIGALKYGGISFQIKNGKVSQIFLGAASE